MVFTRQKERAGANSEFPPRTHPGTNIRETRTPSRKVFTKGQNELFVQRVVQYYQEKEGDELHYHIIGFNESSTEDYKKKAYCNLTRRFHPGKNKYLQYSDVIQR